MDRYQAAPTPFGQGGYARTLPGWAGSGLWRAPVVRSAWLRRLAASYGQAGRTSEANGLLEQVVADSEQLLGNDHPDTVVGRNVLSQWQSAVDDLGQSPL
ncbi:tetratricopeptide repeat protein [Streptomyces sp. NPDC056190]|uniref:tetratricopeptide repeat protein n=1 Tax=unclassified Streptomyces TaxID=2593676 RepID=UPI0035D855C8